ncbi:hypothetical protein [Actinoplanes ianthinogenes]|nr:hypothetical protein [Actinoplanes ianthinogenes]
MRKPFACRLGWHRWVRRSAPDGDRYRECARCGKDQAPPGPAVPF